jgi:predicted metalloprotease
MENEFDYSDGCKTLARAFEIFAKYSDSYSITGCEHDIMYVYINYENVSDEDIIELGKCGFHAEDEYSFQSYRFGSA